MAVPRAVIFGTVVLIIAIVVSKVIESETKSYTKSFVIEDTPRDEVFRFFYDQKKFYTKLRPTFSISDLKKSKTSEGLDRVSYIATSQPITILGIYETSFTLPTILTVLEENASISINMHIRGIMAVNENWTFADQPEGGILVTEQTDVTSYKAATGLVLSEIKNSHTLLYRQIKAVFEKKEQKTYY